MDLPRGNGNCGPRACRTRRRVESGVRNGLVIFTSTPCNFRRGFFDTLFLNFFALRTQVKAQSLVQPQSEAPGGFVAGLVSWLLSSRPKRIKEGNRTGGSPCTSNFSAHTAAATSSTSPNFPCLAIPN